MIKFVQVGKGKFVDREAILIIEDCQESKEIRFVVQYPYPLVNELQEERCSYDELKVESTKDYVDNLNAMRND